jgi:putative PIN family toxin of toxin-antitoxin system
MVKVVIDTNVFVSSILNPKGIPAKILDLVRDEKIMMVTSLLILKEAQEVLLYPHVQKLHGFDEPRVDLELNKIRLLAEITAGSLKLEVVKDDPSDNKFIECAVESLTDYIISVDHHLRDIKEYQGIKIISPAEFLNYWNSL